MNTVRLLAASNGDWIVNTIGVLATSVDDGIVNTIELLAVHQSFVQIFDLKAFKQRENGVSLVEVIINCSLLSMIALDFRGIQQAAYQCLSDTTYPRVYQSAVGLGSKQDNTWPSPYQGGMLRLSMPRS